MHIRKLVLTLALLCAACGGDGTGSTDQPGPPATLTQPGGATLSGTVGTALSTPLVVRVADPKGKPVAGVSVAWSVAAGGGTVTPAATITDAAGEARTVWTLGTAAGTATVTATVAGVAPATFTASAAPGAPAQLQWVSGDRQLAVAGSALPQPIRVRAIDLYENVVPGATVSFAVAGGVGTVSPATAVTGADGTASVQLSAGAELARSALLRLTATVPGASGASLSRPLDFYGRRPVMAFLRVSDRGFNRAAVLDLLTNTETYITPEAAFPYRAALSPDGSMLAYEAVSDDDGYFVLPLMNLATGQVRELYRGKFTDTYSIAWAPDNETLAVGIVDYDTQRRRIATVNVKTGAVNEDLFPGLEVNAPSYSASGVMVFAQAFPVTGRSTRQFELMTRAPDGTVSRVTRTDAVSESFPVFASTDRIVHLCTSSTTRIPHVCAVDLSGANPVQITSDDQFEEDFAAVSRDGTTVAFDRYRAGRTDLPGNIFFAPIQGGAVTAFAGNTSRDEWGAQYGVYGWDAPSAASRISARFPVVTPSSRRDPAAGAQLRSRMEAMTRALAQKHGVRTAASSTIPNP